MANTLDSVMNEALEGIKQMVDVETIIGEPLTLDDGKITLIPISKASFGFAAGGSSFGKATEKDNFGGGAGGGVKVTPVAFICVKDSNVSLLPVVERLDAVDRVTQLLPDLVDKIASYFKKDEDEKTE